MRGDSLRDFYAKTLAVIGLGLLAGAGAVVDYWPVAAPLPVVESAALPSPVSPVLAQRLDQNIPLPRATNRAHNHAALRAANLGPARFLTPTFKAAAAASTPSVAPVAQPASTLAPVAPAAPDTTLSISDVTLTELLEPQLLAWHTMEPSRLQMAPASGLIGGALRKTKDSLVRTGAVTGSTIADAFKGVVGAFKKVSPF